MEPESWGCVGLSGSCLPFSPFHVNRHRPRCSSPVILPTAPSPILRMFHQSANHRIRVHVIQLILLLSTGVHVEIVKPRLPERPQRFSRLTKRQAHLPRAHRPSALPQFPRPARATAPQERGGEKKSACCVRNDWCAGMARGAGTMYRAPTTKGRRGGWGENLASGDGGGRGARRVRQVACAGGGRAGRGGGVARGGGAYAGRGQLFYRPIVLNCRIIGRRGYWLPRSSDPANRPIAFAAVVVAGG